ncbi:MAG: 1-acyl-sn-glycerol-3-phosphate acyltransferase [Bacteroidota bacterium]
MSGFFIGIYEKLLRKPVVFYTTTGLLIAFIAFFSSGIRFSEDITSIIPNDERIEKISSILNHSKFADQLVFNFFADSASDISPDSLIEYAGSILRELETDTALISEIIFEIRDDQYAEMYDFFYDHLPFYLDSIHYQRLESLLTPDETDITLQKDLKVLLSPTGLALKKQIFRDPFHITPGAIERLKNFQFDDNFTIYQSHIFTKDRKHLMAFLVPANPSSNITSGSKLMSDLEDVLSRQANPDIKVEYYGGTAVAVANAHRIETDILITVPLALLLLLALFLRVFRKKRVIFILFFPVLFAAGISLAILIISEGTISAIALGIGAVLLGILVDYPIHLYSHYRISGNMRGTIRTITNPLIMSSITTASGFLCLYLVRSEALNQLGLFAALSIFFNAIITLTLFSYILEKIYPVSAFSGTPFKSFGHLSNYTYENNRILLISIAAITLIFIFTPGSVGFNGDLSTMNYLPDNLKNAEKNLMKISTQTLSNVYLITSGKTRDEALYKSEKYQGLMDSLINEGLAGRKSSASDLILSTRKQKEKIDLWNHFWDRMNRDRIKRMMVEAGNKSHFREDAFNPFYNLINKEFSPVQEESFSLIQSIFLKNYLTENENLISAITMLKVENKNKPAVFKRVMKYDELVVFDKQVFVNRFFEILKEDFNILVTVSMLLVFLILLLIFGRIELALVTLIPLLLSWFWTLGFMKLFGIEFNIFNVIISSYIFGLGIDFCIFIVQGSINNYKYGTKGLATYRISVILAAITTVVGIAVLLFARHPALRSIALVSVFGITSALIMSITIVPVLFSALVYHKGKKRVEPVTLKSFLVSIIAFLMFLGGSVLLTLLIPVLKILPIGRKKIKYFFHYLISGTLRIVVYSIFPIRKVIEIRDKVNFKQPSVIVCNHQSHLDLSIILMLNPKIIVLTNRWVWNNPFYGFVVRFAEFYPIFRGLDQQLAGRLQKKVNEGYSILVFPEGTRTRDGQINRFHQGAFWLADKLNIEIQPLLLHGANHCLIKSEFFLRPGSITLRALEKIKVTKVKDGESYKPQSQSLRNLYRREFERMSIELETPDYFRKRLINQFLYKGPVIEWYGKVKISLEKNYNYFNNLIPREASIVDIGCGYGFLSHMLCMVSEKRRILGLDYDGEKIAIARQIETSVDRARFEEADILNFELPEADVFLLLDVLHYLPAEFHEQVIEKCMQKLNYDGMIFIRDADADLKTEMWRTRWNEFNSTRFFRFNKTNYASLSYTSGTFIENIASKHNFVVERKDNPSKKSDVTFILKRSAE